MVVSVVLWSKAPLTWDEPLVRRSLVDLFLGGMLEVFSRARKHDR
jgi:hypothetical protein